MSRQINKMDTQIFVAGISLLWHRLLCIPPRKICGCTFLFSVFMASFSMQAFCQTETFDIITYKPFSNEWKKQIQPGVVNFTHVNAATGSFCVIAMYASSASSGDAQKDFINEWKELVVVPYNSDPNPKTEIQTIADGWKTVVGAAPVKLDGADVYIILAVFSGFGKKISIRSSLNNQSYAAQIDALLATIKPDKNKEIVSSNNTVPAQIHNATGQFGLMNYSTPPGWKEQKFQDGVVFKPMDLPAGDLLAVQIMQPLNMSGTLEQALAQSFDEATAMYNGSSMYQADGKYSKNGSQKSFNGWNYIRGKGSIQVTGGDERGLELFVIKINNRYERIAILESRKYCGGVSRYFASDNINYRTAIEIFLYSLQFSDFNAIVLKSGNINGNGLTGVWEGTIQSTGAATGVRLDVFVPVFFNNGQVYFGPKFPTEGLYELNSRIPPELFPRNWGTYTFNNGNGMLKMPFADIPFRLENKKLVVTKNQKDWHFFKLNTVDGARFNGTYTMSESYGIHPVITFKADGKFNDNGVIRVLSHEGTTCVNPGFKPGAGSYVVKDFTITFYYSDGRKVKIAFLGTEYDKTELSPAIIRMSYNDDPLNRQ